MCYNSLQSLLHYTDFNCINNSYSKVENPGKNQKLAWTEAGTETSISASGSRPSQDLCWFLDMLIRKSKFTLYFVLKYSVQVISPEPLDKLEKMVQVFEQIPNKKTLSLSLEDYPLPVTRCNFVK